MLPLRGALTIQSHKVCLKQTVHERETLSRYFHQQTHREVSVLQTSYDTDPLSGGPALWFPQWSADFPRTAGRFNGVLLRQANGRPGLPAGQSENDNLLRFSSVPTGGRHRRRPTS